MNYQKSLHLASVPTFFAVAALLLSNSSLADTLHFRVAFESVPGIEEIEAGKMKRAIEVLEDQLARIDSESSGDILATLCGVFIVDQSLDKAERVCNKAVKINPTKTAYNNRGVFRAFTGNLSGARADFNRARPLQLDVYLEELRTTDVPLVADGNFYLVNKLLSEGKTARPVNAAAPRIVAIGDLED